MTADTIDDLGLSFDEVSAEAARDNRPSFNHNPIKWRGKLASITRGSEMFTNGQEYPRHAFNFEGCHFIDVGNAMDTYHEGDSFTLLIQPIDPTKAKRFQQLGKSVLATGQNLEKFVGDVVEVTEITETYKKANGYDAQSYHWKFEKVGEGIATAAKPTEPTELGIQVATALLNGPAVDRDGVATDKAWQLGDFKYWAQKTPGIDIVLLGQIADGSWPTLKAAGVS